MLGGEIMDVTQVFKTIAKQQNKTLEQVRGEIIEAIDYAMANPDPEVKAFWKELAPDGKAPSPEDFVQIMAEIAKMQGITGNE